MKESQLNLVDLAGSERQKDTNAVGQRLKVSERPLHVLTCTCTHSFTSTYVNGSYFFIYKVQQMFLERNIKKYSKCNICNTLVWAYTVKCNTFIHVCI